MTYTFIAKVQRDGLAVIPRNLRNVLGISAGDLVELTLHRKVENEKGGKKK